MAAKIQYIACTGMCSRVVSEFSNSDNAKKVKTILRGFFTLIIRVSDEELLCRMVGKQTD